jgi:class 3 adenylate cyclase
VVAWRLRGDFGAFHLVYTGAVSDAAIIMRVRFPLWARMALAFGGLIGLFMLLWGGWELRRDLAEEEARREARLVGLAETLAVNLDGAAHAALTRTDDMGRESYAQMLERLRAARVANGLDWVGSSARDGRGHFYTVLDGGSPPPIPVGYPIFDGIALRERVYDGEVVFEPQMNDEWGEWTVAMAPLRGPDGSVIGVVEVMEDAAWQSLYAGGVLWRTLAQTLAVILLSIGLAAAFARRIGLPLRGLTEAALAVAAGDLEQDVSVGGRGEVGALSQAFEAMVAGLRERERIRETFGRFVSDEVATRALAEGGGVLGGDARTVSILFSDLRGFSAMSMQQSPAETLAILNRYFSVMTDVILAHEGNVSELLGDGMVVLFGAPIQHDDDAERAVLCAIEMQQALDRFCAAVGLQLEMGIGIATGTVVAGNIGSEKRMKYGVVGPPINLAARLEGFTVGTQILICEATREAAGDAVEVADRMEVRAKGWADPIGCYPVRAAGTASALEETMILSWTTVSLPARCRPIRGKRLSTDARDVQVLGVTRRNLIVKAAWPLAVRDQLQLDIGSGPEAITEVYGLVTEASGGEGSWLATLRVTSISEASQRRLFQLAAQG